MQVYTFHKGLRLDKPEWEMQPGEMPELTNFVFGDEQGLLRKRRGLSRILSSTQGATGVQGLVRSSVGGSNPHTLVVIGGSLYRVRDELPSWEPVHAGLFDGNPVRFETWKDEVFFVTGADALYAWNGSSVREVVTAPAGCSFISQFSNRLFVASSSLFPDTVFYSDLLDPDVWADPETQIQNLIDVSTGDNQRITGIVRTREQLTIFKSHSTYYLVGTDPTDWVLRRVSDSVGCIAPGSIVEMDGRTIWLSSRGVYMDDGVHFYRIGAAIQPFVSTLTSAQQEKAVATTSGWHYLLLFPDTPEGPVAFVYHVRLEAWVRWNLGIPIGSVCPKNLPTDNGGWIGGHAQIGRIYEGESGGSDDGEIVAARLRLPSIGDQAPEMTLDLRRVVLDAHVAATDLATVSWSMDGKTPVVRPFSGSGPVIYSTPIGTIGQKFTISAEIAGSGTESFVRGIAADVRLKRRRW